MIILTFTDWSILYDTETEIWLHLHVITAMKTYKVCTSVYKYISNLQETIQWLLHLICNVSIEYANK